MPLEINDNFLLWISFSLLISFLSWILQSFMSAGGIWFLTQISLGSMRVVPSQSCLNLSCTYVGAWMCSRLTDQIFVCLPSRENKMDSNQDIQYVFLGVPVRLWMFYGVFSGISTVLGWRKRDSYQYLYDSGHLGFWSLKEQCWNNQEKWGRRKSTKLGRY